MTFEMHLKRIVGTASRFIKTKGGNVAPMFAFAALPILAATGAAIDYTRAVAARSAMQAAVDSTALMLAQDAATLTPADLNIKAQAYFNALYTNPEVAGITVAAAYTANTGNGATVAVTGQGNLSTEFMQLVGYTMVPLNVASTSTWGNTKLRVAIALDVTGSMNDDGKLPAMKTAAKSLIDSLRSSAKATGDVFVSIIPFNQMVNVNPTNKNASWIDITTDYGVCTNSNGNTNNTYKTKVTCTNAGKTWTTSNLNSWTGCVWDRGSNTPTTNDYDTTKTVPVTTTPTTLYQTKNYSSCPATILPMMSIYAASDAQIVKDKIEALVAAGNTNQAIGMHWAWMSLQQTLPLNSPAKDVNVQYTDAIILLSDGLNTQDRWYTSATSIDNRQKTLCDTIKDPTNGKTVIYTIQVNTSGDAESAVLKYCANTGNFYPTTTTSGIANAFNQIGTSLMKLRIAH